MLTGDIPPSETVNLKNLNRNIEEEESSSKKLNDEKPVVVRVKRKTSQSSLDAFWLEINERPLKRALLDLDKLSISDSSNKVQEYSSRKILVRHVETITTSDVLVDILQSLMQSNSADAFPSKGKSVEVRRAFKTESKQDQLLVKARQRQESLSKNARFEQIWRSRKEKKDFVHKGLNEMCRLYDVVRVDAEEKSSGVQDHGLSTLEDFRMMSQFLPLLREVLPSAAVDVEADIKDCRSKIVLPDNYVYDYYVVEDGMEAAEDHAASAFPLVQVDDDEAYYDGPDDSEYETDDSNAEDNPMNDYPDEESSENENQLEESDGKSESEERSSGTESEEDDSDSQKANEPDEFKESNWSDHADNFSYEDEANDDDGIDFIDFGSDDGEW